MRMPRPENRHGTIGKLRPMAISRQFCAGRERKAKRDALERAHIRLPFDGEGREADRQAIAPRALAVQRELEERGGSRREARQGLARIGAVRGKPDNSPITL